MVEIGWERVDTDGQMQQCASDDDRSLLCHSLHTQSVRLQVVVNIYLFRRPVDAF